LTIRSGGLLTAEANEVNAEIEIFAQLVDFENRTAFADFSAKP
jgi:hypothetical protein